jgi:hypothetical protein
MHGLHWLPVFQPIAGHAWLLGHVRAGSTWKEAEATGPWRRYTSLRFDLSDTYPRARLDWWIYEFDEGPRRRSAHVVLAGLLAAAVVAGGWAWRRRGGLPP